MNSIFCLIGKGSTGKDTIFSKIIKDRSLNLKPIVLYTTRPIRENEKDGINYHFISKTDFEKFQNENKIIEFRKYNTINGEWIYATINENIFLEKYNYITITTIDGFIKLKDFFKNVNIYSIYIELDDEERFFRAVKREKKQPKNIRNYNELCRRFLADSSDFSEERIKLLNIERKFFNYNLNHCVKEIKKYILSKIFK